MWKYFTVQFVILSASQNDEYQTIAHKAVNFPDIKSETSSIPEKNINYMHLITQCSEKYLDLTGVK